MVARALSHPRRRARGTSRLNALEVWPARAQYRPGERPGLRLAARGASNARVALRVTCLDGARVAAASEGEVALDADGRGELALDPVLTEAERAAYAIEVVAAGVRATTALDVATHWARAPRYGFVCEFPPDESPGRTAARAEALARLHLNVVQHYDWMASHHTYRAPSETFTDPLGRRLSHATLARLIASCRERGIASLAYAALYGAERDFSEAHPDWLLYDAARSPLRLADRFYLQDPSSGSPWREWILGQYEQAVRGFGFDGLHIDQYGFPKRALSRVGGDWHAVELANVFPGFVEEACRRVRAIRADGGAIFNCVNAWPLEALRAVTTDAATYIEVWEPHTTYRDLYELARRARLLRPEKPAILAAYLAPFAATPRSAGAMPAFRLAFATIHAAGATQLVAGESGALLTEAYYPRHASLDEGELAFVRRAFDFVVRNGTRLHDLPPEDLAWTHVGPTNGVLTLATDSLGDYGAGPRTGAVCVVLREADGIRVLQLVNLRGVSDDRWNVAHERGPDPVGDIEVTVQVVGAVHGVWWDTPDDAVGRPRALPFAVAGGALRFRIPRLDVWCIAWWS